MTCESDIFSTLSAHFLPEYAPLRSSRSARAATAVPPSLFSEMDVVFWFLVDLREMPTSSNSDFCCQEIWILALEQTQTPIVLHDKGVVWQRLDIDDYLSWTIQTLNNLSRKPIRLEWPHSLIDPPMNLGENIDVLLSARIHDY